MLTSGRGLGSYPCASLLRLLPSVVTAGALLLAASNVYFMTESKSRETRRNSSTIPRPLRTNETGAHSEHDRVFVLYVVETLEQAESILRDHGDPSTSGASEPQSAPWPGQATALGLRDWGTVIVIPGSAADDAAQGLMFVASSELVQAGAELRVIDLRRKVWP